MSWLRVEATIFTDAKMIRAGFWGGQAFLAAITMAKMHGWRGGRVPKADFDPPLIARHLNAVTVQGVTDELAKGITECVRVGLMSDDGSHYLISRWNKYQQDTTNAERQERTRERKRTAARVPQNQRSPLRTSDVTGRDGTGQSTVHVTSSPVDAAGSASAGDPASPAASVADQQPRTLGTVAPVSTERKGENAFQRMRRLECAASASRLKPLPTLPPEELERRKADAIRRLSESG